jgi:hypothetical protein
MEPNGRPTGQIRANDSWWFPVAVTSAGLVVIALVAAVFLGQRDAAPVEETAAPLTSRIGLAARAALVALGSDEAEFAAAREELLSVFDARREELPEETREAVLENLQIIEGQIEAISEELSRDPDNPRLARLLAAAYQRELELLQRVAGLPGLSQVEGDS